MDFKKVADVAALGKRLMNEYGLIDEGWTFKLDNAKTRIGQCRYREKEIGYSMTYIDLTPMHEIEDTIRHEIAHALVGPNEGHGWRWKAKAIEVGAKPQSCGDSNNVAKAKPNFIIECSGCGQRWKRFRLKRKLIGQPSSCCKAPLKAYRITRRRKEA